MKKVLKLFVVIFILNQCFAYADFIKPNAKIKPGEVIKIQLKSLMKNDAPSKDNGIKQTWYFAHPDSKYFGLGKVNEEQIRDISKRKRLDYDSNKKWYSSVLI